MDGDNIEKVGKVGKSENAKSIVMDGDSIKKVGKVGHSVKFQEHRDGWIQSWKSWQE